MLSAIVIQFLGPLLEHSDNLSLAIRGSLVQGHEHFPDNFFLDNCDWDN